jgi:hypothetical protein
MDSIILPSGSSLMTMGPSSGTLTSRGPMNNHIPSTYMPSPTTALICPLKPCLPNSITYSQGPAATFKSCKPPLLRWMTRVWLGRSPTIKRLMIRLLHWLSSLRPTSMTLMLHRASSCSISPVLCLCMLWFRLRCFKKLCTSQAWFG